MVSSKICKPKNFVAALFDVSSILPTILDNHPSYNPNRPQSPSSNLPPRLIVFLQRRQHSVRLLPLQTTSFPKFPTRYWPHKAYLGRRASVQRSYDLLQQSHVELL